MIQFVRLILISVFLLPLPVIAQTVLADALVKDEAAFRQDENDPAFYLELISGMQQRRLFFAALAHLDVFDQKWPNDRRAKLLRADALRQTNDFASSSSIYRRLIEQEPTAGAFHGLGLIAAAQGNRAEAERLLLQANRLSPIDVRILNDLGYVQLLNGQRADARMSLHKAVELDAKNRQVGANLALYHFLENDPLQAERIMGRFEFSDEQKEMVRQDALRLGYQ